MKFLNIALHITEILFCVGVIILIIRGRKND